MPLPHAVLSFLIACVVLLSGASVEAGFFCPSLIDEAVIARILESDTNLKLSNVKLKWEAEGYKYVAKIFVKKKEIGEFDYETYNETLAFNIFLDPDLSPNYQDRGIYSVLMQKVLELHPEVKYVPSTMEFMDSDSAFDFFQELFELIPVRTGDDLFEVGYLKNLLQNDKVLIRESILDQFKKTPAYKVRDRSGYSDIETIALYNIGSGDYVLTFNVKKGKYNPARTKVAIQSEDGVVHSLSTSGGTKKIPRSEIIFPDYELIRPHWLPSPLKLLK